MKIIHYQKVDDSQLPTGSTAKTFSFCIKIDDVKENATTLIDAVTDTSWIKELDPVGKVALQHTAQRTIDRLVKIFQSSENPISKEFGEFMISLNSGFCLRSQNNHEILPLSEIWKTKVLGNGGFDLHTVSPENNFNFGEAKYRSSGNAYGEAADQVIAFIHDKKDAEDLIYLEKFNKPSAVSNLLDKKRGFILAFSINSEDHQEILDNALQNDGIKNLAMSCEELYIIGVKI